MLSDAEIKYYEKMQEHEEEEREKVPKIVFKYRSLKGTLNFDRVLDIVKNNRLYMPAVKELNDPFEGRNVAVEHLPAEAYDRLENWRTEHRVLSLSATCFSTLMWANYASEEDGVSIGFYSNDSFSGMEPIEYLNDNTDKQWLAFEDSCVHHFDFKYKSKDWAYEEEYRIESDYSKYLSFNHDEIACVVVGENLNEEVRNILLVELEQEEIPILNLKKDYDKKKYYVVPNTNPSKKIYGMEDLEQYLCESK